MEDESVHKCKGCENQIPEAFNFCLACQDKLNKQGLCGCCGKEPRDLYSKSPLSRKYCGSCCNSMKREIKKRTQRAYFYESYRPPEARENTHETKHGTGH